MDDKQQIIDEIDKLKQKLIDIQNKLKNQKPVDDVEVENNFDVEEQNKLLEQLDNNLNTALLNLVVKKD